jgi:hypothetical protein
VTERQTVSVPTNRVVANFISSLYVYNWKEPTRLVFVGRRIVFVSPGLKRPQFARFVVGSFRPIGGDAVGAVNQFLYFSLRSLSSGAIICLRQMFTILQKEGHLCAMLRSQEGEVYLAAAFLTFY